MPDRYMNERTVISSQAWPDEYAIFVEKEDEETLNCELDFLFAANYVCFWQTKE